MDVALRISRPPFRKLTQIQSEDRSLIAELEDSIAKIYDGR